MRYLTMKEMIERLEKIADEKCEHDRGGNPCRSCLAAYLLNECATNLRLEIKANKLFDIEEK